jgi:tyrosine-protein kinase Etk/Wzc
MSEKISSAEAAGPGLSARDLARLMRRQWLLISIVAFAVVGAVAAVVVRTPDVYQANSVIRITDRRGSLTTGVNAMPMQRVMGPQTDPILSDIQILKSRAVLTRVIEQEGLRLNVLGSGLPDSLLYEPSVSATALPDTLRFDFTTDNYRVTNGKRTITARYGEMVSIAGASFSIQGNPGSESAAVAVLAPPRALELLRENLGAAPREKTNVVDVEYLTVDPHKAQRVVNSVVTTFRDLSSHVAQQESRNRREFLQDQLRQTDSMMAEAQTQLSRFRSREQLYSSQEKFAAQQTGLMTLEVERQNLAAERSVYTSLLSRLDTPREREAALDAIAASPAVAQNPVILRLNEQLGRYQAMRDSLTAIGGNRANNPDVKRADSLIAETQERLANAARSHVAFLDKKLESMGQLLRANATQLQSIPATESEEVQLTQRLLSLKEVASQIREEYQKARVAEAIQLGEIEIVDLAERPVEPLSTGKLPKVFFALVFGIILGTFLAFLRDHLNTSINRREDLESLLGLSGLAVVPRIGAAGRMFIPRPLRVWEVKGISNGHGANGRNGNSALVAVNDGRSPAAEAYRTLRTNLMFSSTVRQLRTLAVTSAAPGEGKTTTAANLAVIMAHQRGRVLLIDCDLRRPRMHEIFHLERTPGLSELLLGADELDDVIRRTETNGLDVIPAGTIPFNPAELLGSERMKKLIDQFASSYDFVILDSAPVLVAADASILSQMTDGVLLVVSAGGTDRDAARDAVDQLRGVGANVIGAVLNDLHAKLPRYGAYAYTYASYHEK